MKVGVAIVLLALPALKDPFGGNELPELKDPFGAEAARKQDEAENTLVKLRDLKDPFARDASTRDPRRALPPQPR